MPAPSPSPSAAPSPGAKLLSYWYETPIQRSTVPLLRFEDQAEVRSLEMNAAIARFFDNSSPNGDMTRGATSGGAPTLEEMKNYRPHMSPSLDFMAIAMALKNGGLSVLKGAYKSRVERNEELLRALLLRDAAKATPTPDVFEQAAPSPTPSPSPSPTPIAR